MFFCVLINILSKYLFNLIEDYKKSKLLKKQVNNIDFNKILKEIDRDFYDDISQNDIDNEK